MLLIILAVLAGAGFTALATLALNVHSPFFLYPSLLALTPGGVIASLIHPEWSELGRALPVLAFNMVFYSCVTYAILRWKLRFEAIKVKNLVLTLIVPVVVLMGLACTPHLSPLWPRGMERLRDREQSLRTDLPVGMNLMPARTVLKSAGLESSEEEIQERSLVFSNGKATLTAQPGEKAVFARSDTVAEQFPCTYVVQVVLIFGIDGRLRDKYVGTQGICP